MISGKQIKAARAMLDWSQQTLAQVSGLSTGTIINLEKGFLSARSCGEVEKTLRQLGFEIIGETGVNQCASTSQTYSGAGNEHFLSDMITAVGKNNRPILAVFESKKYFLRAFGLQSEAKSDRFEELTKLTAFKCLFTDAGDIPAAHRRVEFRSVPRYPLGPQGLIFYGDRTTVIHEIRSEWTYFVMRSVEIALKHQKEFHSIWSGARSLL